MIERDAAMRVETSACMSGGGVHWYTLVHCEQTVWMWLTHLDDSAGGGDARGHLGVYGGSERGQGLVRLHALPRGVTAVTAAAVTPPEFILIAVMCAGYSSTVTPAMTPAVTVTTAVTTGAITATTDPAATAVSAAVAVSVTPPEIVFAVKIVVVVPAAAAASATAAAKPTKASSASSASGPASSAS